MKSVKKIISGSFPHVLLIAGILQFFQYQVFAQAPLPAVTQALQTFKGKPGAAVSITRHKDSSRIRSMKGNLSSPSQISPERAAVKFMEDASDVFQMSSTSGDMMVTGTQESLTGSHVHFKQSYKGLPVFNGGISIHLRKDRSVFLSHNNYMPGINLDVLPGLQEKTVIGIAVDDLINNYLPSTGSSVANLPEWETAPRAELGILEYQGSALLAYRVTLDLASPRTLMEYYADAGDGKILRRRSLLRRATGKGKVFNPNPVNRLNDTGLFDRKDASGAVPAEAYTTVSLRGLRRSNGYYFLIGPYVRVTDRLQKPFYYPSGSGYVKSRSRSFYFSRSSPKFEHVMAYYHIDSSQRYIQSLGYTNVVNRRVRVDPHGASGRDNSYYIPSPVGAGFIVFGEGGVDDAEDADIILHEYGHAITDNQTHGGYLDDLCNTESSAIDEGFADYWASSSLYNISVLNGFDPACFGEWDMVPFCMRRVDGTKHYPEDMAGECHDDGEMWSAFLWDIFNSTGRTVADTIAIESHFLVPYLPTFSEGVQAIVAADTQLYGGAHADIICNAASNRGFMIYSDCIGGQ